MSTREHPVCIILKYNTEQRCALIKLSQKVKIYHPELGGGSIKICDFQNSLSTTNIPFKVIHYNFDEIEGFQIFIFIGTHKHNLCP